MNLQLKIKWDLLEEERELIENELKMANLPQQKFSGRPESWNMLQVMAHIIAVEKVSFDFHIRKNYSNTRKAKGKMHFFRAFILRVRLASPFRFKVPPIAALSPLDNYKFQDLQNDWKQERAHIKQYLEGFPEDKRDHLIFRHPIMDWLTIEQTLAFLVEHIMHHRQQINRIKKTTGFPL